MKKYYIKMYSKKAWDQKACATFHIKIQKAPKTPLKDSFFDKIIKTGITGVGTRGAGTSEFRDN
jgi:hypothetical protein